MKMKWDPFKDMILVNEFFDPITTAYDKDNSSAWSPAVDVYETGKSIVLTAEIPGVSNEDINLSIYDNILTFKGERRFERDVRQENYQMMERNYGTFCRRFSMPCEVDGNKITASFKDGVLKVTIPKKATTKKVNVELKK